MKINKLNEGTLDPKNERLRDIAKNYVKCLKKLQWFNVRSKIRPLEYCSEVTLTSKKYIPGTDNTTLNVRITIFSDNIIITMDSSPHDTGYEYIFSIVDKINNQFSDYNLHTDQNWFTRWHYITSEFIKLKGIDDSSTVDEVVEALDREITPALEIIDDIFNDNYKQFEIDWKDLKYED